MASLKINTNALGRCGTLAVKGMSLTYDKIELLMGAYGRGTPIKDHKRTRFPRVSKTKWIT